MGNEIYAALFVLAICLFFKFQYSYWARKKVDGPAPYPIFGNMFDTVFQRKHFGMVYDEFYTSYPKSKYVGFYKMSKPAVLIRDLDLVRDILVSDFSSFADNDFIVDSKLDPLLATSPFVTPISHWREARLQIQPLFTAAKIRQIFPMTSNVCKNMLEYIECSPSSLSDDGFETKDLCSKFTIDNIASCAFGVEGESFVNPDSKFYIHGRDIFGSSLIASVRSMLTLFLPSVAKILRVPFISSTCDKWIRKMVTDVIAYRKANNEIRNDMLQAVMQMQEKGEIDLETVIGHSLLFLTEGFETSSTLMAYALYQIASNGDIQRKLQNEIDATLKKHNGQLTEEGVNELTYMDRVFYETLRIHSPAFSLAKIATKDYKLPAQYSDSPKTDGVTIKAGTSIIIPVYSIHLDPEVYEKPYVFDPERFTEENQSQRHKYSFLPFGEGPRICLGMRFGMMQSKTAIASILAKFDVKVTSKTIEPLQPSSKTFLLANDNGIWVKFTKRS